jgi:hypothetical protein
MPRSFRTSSVNGRPRSLPPEAGERLERVLERFEGAWRSGQRPLLDDCFLHLILLPQALLGAITSTEASADTCGAAIFPASSSSFAI